MFRSHVHEQFDIDLESHNLVQEKTIKIEYPREYSNMVLEVNARGWMISAHPSEDAPLVKVSWIQS